MRGVRLQPGREAHLYMCACVGLMLVAIGALMASGLVSGFEALIDALLSGVAATATLAVLQT